jgi:hypothetical protein
LELNVEEEEWNDPKDKNLYEVTLPDKQMSDVNEEPPYIEHALDE